MKVFALFRSFIRWNRVSFLWLMFGLAACQGGNSVLVPTAGLVAEQSRPDLNTPALTATLLPTFTATASVTPAPTHTTIPTPTLTPEPLAEFQPVGLPRDVTAQGYIQEQCKYLALRLDPQKAEPGTIVVPIMYHSVVKDGRPLKDNTSIDALYFRSTLTHAKELGFETITTAELIDFLYNNAPIPPRSLLLIVDDRRPGVVREHFLPVLQQNHWTVTLAYITGVNFPYEWDQLAELHKAGVIDVQSHGFLHNGSTYFTEFTPEETIQQEIFAPIEVIEERFGTRPYAFIWPGGNFTSHTVEVARKAGYQVGFTVFSRGPIMFNWIPQGEQERKIGDPLMLLPRYWSTAAYINLDDAVKIGDAARQFADENRESELNWYNSYCPDRLQFGQTFEKMEE